MDIGVWGGDKRDFKQKVSKQRQNHSQYLYGVFHLKEEDKKGTKNVHNSDVVKWKKKVKRMA